MLDFLNKLNSVVWGVPTLLVIFFTGVILTLRTNFFQIRFFKNAFKTFFQKRRDAHGAQLTPLQSVSTALSATMGTGNIVGVAGAIALGGPGAVFWMWVSAAFCMIIKFSEIALSIHYREQGADGSYSGGVMYYIKNGLPRIFAPLGTVFCICGVIAAFGVGNMTQINTMSASVSALARTVFDLSPKSDFFVKFSVGVLCAFCCCLILKNDRSIGKFCEKIFPVMTLLYIAVTTLAIALNYQKIPLAFYDIFVGAFDPKGVTGGTVGSAFVALRFGMSRGVFSNEAGLGTAPTVYACSKGDEVSLGFLGIMEVFIDTIVVCTLTALTVLCAGDITFGVDYAADITFNALSSVFGKNIIFIFCPVVCFFAFSSVIGWGLYGSKFAAFLLGNNFKRVFLVIFVLAQIPAAVFRAEVIWLLAEILNGFMILPNITALLFLTNKVADITCEYKRKLQDK